MDTMRMTLEDLSVSLSQHEIEGRLPRRTALGEIFHVRRTEDGAVSAVSPPQADSHHHHTTHSDPHSMFKHVTKRGAREGSSGSSSAESDASSADVAAALTKEEGPSRDEREEEEEEEEDGEEFTGFGDEDEDDEMQDEDGEDAEEEEELPANLPSLKEAVHNPIFELSADAKGRKTVRAETGLGSSRLGSHSRYVVPS